MSRVPLALTPEVEKQLNREIEEAWHLMHISRGLTAGFWTEVQRAIEREYRLRGLLRIRRSARQAAKAVVVAGLLLAAAIAAPTAHASEPFTADDTIAAIQDAPYMVRCIVTGEVGGTGFNPYSVGLAGEQGIAQLLPTGPGASPWNEFWYGDWTPLDPSLRSTWNPWQAAAFLEQYGAEHGYGAWTTARYCA